MKILDMIKGNKELVLGVTGVTVTAIGAVVVTKTVKAAKVKTKAAKVEKEETEEVIIECENMNDEAKYSKEDAVNDRVINNSKYIVNVAKAWMPVGVGISIVAVGGALSVNGLVKSCVDEFGVLDLNKLLNRGSIISSGLIVGGCVAAKVKMNNTTKEESEINE